MFKKIICQHNFVILKKPYVHNGELLTDIICIKCGKRHDGQPVHNNKCLEKEKVICYE